MERCQGEEEWARDSSGFLCQSGLRYNSCVCVLALISHFAACGCWAAVPGRFHSQGRKHPALCGRLLAGARTPQRVFRKNRNINLVWRGTLVTAPLFANISASVQFCLIEHVKAFISRAQYFGYTAKTGPAPCQARQRGSGRSWKQHWIAVGGPNELAIQRLAYTSSISCNIDLWG